MKSVETRLAETKPDAEDTLAPVAVPFFSAEEAEKLNEQAKEYALAEKEREEPFFRFYENEKIESVAFEGTIRTTSSIPDPAKNDYDNCLYALFLEIESLQTDRPKEKLSKEIIINVPIMKDKKIINNNIFNPGDKVYVVGSEYGEMPQGIQEIQLSDDIQSFEHQCYYALITNRINSFSNTGNKVFATREITIQPIQTLPKDEKAARLRKERIEKEISRIEEEVKKHGGSFVEWKNQYKPIADKYKKLCEEGFKGWIGDSFFSARDAETNMYRIQENIEGLLPYSKYLKKNNIDLLLVRVPSRGDFAARVLASEEFEENPAWVEYQYNCLKNDLEIIDAMPEMWKHRFDFPLFYLYNSTDRHPTEGAFYTIAESLADVLKRYKYTRLSDEDSLSLRPASAKGTRSLFFWPKGNKKFNPDDKLSFLEVRQHNKPLSIHKNMGSPFLILSNSFGGRYLIPELSIANYTAFFLQHIPDWSYQAGIYNSMLRHLLMNPEQLSNRSCIVLICMEEMFVNHFPPFPKYISDGANCITLEKTLELLSPDIEIIDEDHFLLQKETNGGVSIKSNPNVSATSSENAFSFVLPIKRLKNISTCMIRIFFKSQYSIISAIDYNNGTIIEENCEPLQGANQYTDLFIPVIEGDRRVKVQMIFLDKKHPQIIDKIELWYY